MYGKTAAGENFHNFHGFLLYCDFFLWVMALLIGNISIQKCYSESFSVNIYFPLKTWRFTLHKSFAVYGIIMFSSVKFLMNR